MIPTLQQFSMAVSGPALWLKTLKDAYAVVDETRLPLLVRTSRFAEARITWQGEQWLLSMPLTSAALPRIERTASALRRMNTPHLTEYRILPGEMTWLDSAGNEHTTDLVLQHLPDGVDFATALLRESRETLLNALNTLQDGLRELGFAHNNLKADNLRWTGRRFLPLRYHDAALDDTSGADDTAFDTLREQIAGTSGPQTVSDTTAAYEPLGALTGHRWTSHVFEGLVCVEDEGGYGFVDTANRPVIPAQFLWASDFREGRAEVETAAGMGLIDREGNFVIAPEYEIVDYDAAQSIVHVRSGGRWALFDYLGRRLTEFGTKNE